MKLPLNYSALLIASICLTACNNSSSSNSVAATNTPQASQADKTPQAQPVDPIERISSGDVSFEITHAVELNDDFSNINALKGRENSYRITARLKSPLKSGAVINCVKAKAGDDGVESNIPAGSLSAYVEETVDPGESSAEILCSLSYGGNEVSNVNFPLLKSILVDSEVKVNNLGLNVDGDGNLVIDRLILLKGGVFLTENSGYHFKINKIYSDTSKIQTFSKHDLKAAPDGKDGLSGGHIIIEAKAIVGPLSIIMLGQDGGKQTKIPPPNQKTMPRAPGAVADETVLEDCQGVNKSPGERIESKVSCTYGKIPGHPASNGRDGYPGTKGYLGLRGGNSGTCEVITPNRERLDLVIYHSAGKGGLGGEGGLGGPGQQGGPGAGNYPDGVSGNQGPQGVSGNEGYEGIDEMASNNSAENGAKTN